jgi:hypothetical protein
MKKVTVTADKAGQAIVLSTNNPEFGYVRVEQTRSIVDDNGWLKNTAVAALILGETAELRKAGYNAGQELEGKVIIREQLVPFNKKAPEKDLKVAGDTKITCMVNDKPIYRKAFYNQDANATDQLLPAVYQTSTGKMVSHTNSEAIKAAFAKRAEAASVLNLG